MIVIDEDPEVPTISNQAVLIDSDSEVPLDMDQEVYHDADNGILLLVIRRCLPSHRLRWFLR